VNRVFADTFYFLALLSEGDAAHLSALQISRENVRLVTTAWVVMEVADALSAPANRQAVVDLLDILKHSEDVQIVSPSQEHFDAGFELFRNRPDKYWSLTDCISFEVMREFGISEALTGDRHFEQAGFRALLT